MKTRSIPAWIIAAALLTAALLTAVTIVATPAADAARGKAAAAKKAKKSKRAKKRKKAVRAKARVAKRDRQPPKVSFAAPTGGTVSGTLTGSGCAASASDNVGIGKVAFSVDGTALNTEVQAPYYCAFDTTKVADGTHTIQATAYDVAGNRSSTSVDVTVDNVSEPAPTSDPASTSDPAPAPTTTTTTSTTTAPALVPIGITRTTYYVSPAGSDSNSGTSPTSAWRTVGRVNSATLQPGDGVLFQSGATFSDTTLMPDESGTSGAHIVFGSYGTGRATLTKGIWFSGTNWLAFTNLAVSGVVQGINASASGSGSDNIVIQNMDIRNVGIAVNSANMADDNWTIQNNTIDQTGDSGMILLGSKFLISGNTITNTGTNTAITYGKHGIYLKVVDAQVVANTIRNFHANGVSVRYRNSTVDGNVIEGGPIGVAWFQYDTVAGTSNWRANVISKTTAACFYVSASDQGGPTRESFVVSGNTMSKTGGKYMDLQPTTGTYTVQGNVQL